jgi:HEAT repeat protein/glycerophosphoryl diester phosphodiesterase
VKRNIFHILGATLFLLLMLPHIFAEDIITSSKISPKQSEIFARFVLSEEIPENTFAALKRALELGVDGIEVDIRQTKDNKLILMRDETIDRTTDGKGRVDELLYAEIKLYDAGSWCSDKFKNERVPLLSDVLKFCKINNLKLILNGKQTCLEKQLVDVIRECEMASQVYSWGTLRNPDVEDAELFSKEIVYVPAEELKEEKINQIREEKKYAFSIISETDDRKTIKNQIKLGVDVILVDYPCVAMDILNIKSKKINIRNTFNLTETDNYHEEINDNSTFINEKVKTLIETIRGDDVDKARTSAMAMMVLPAKYTIPPLLKLLNDRNPRVKQNAVWAIGFCGDENIEDYIYKLLKDKNVDVRREAVLALRRLGNKNSASILVDALNKEADPWVRYEIARTLGTLGDRNSAFTLANMLSKEKHWFVKSACVEALRNIKNENIIEPLAKILIADAGEDASLARTMAAWALASFGEKSIHSLTKALSDNEESTRRRAGWALVKIGTPAVKPLIEALHDTNTFTRIRASLTLGWIGDTGAVTSLIWSLRDDDPAVVSASVWALGMIGSPEALPYLHTLANSKNEDIRENAIESIEKIMANKASTESSNYIE